jgi:hypothetical protein
MNKLLRLFLLSLLITSAGYGQWKVQYVTEDDVTNGTGYNTPGVTVMRDNKFIAVVTSPGSCSYLSLYVNADSLLGRVKDYGYSPEGYYQLWNSGFEEVSLNLAWKAAMGPDSMIYVANNDPAHNILVFAVKDTLEPADFRMETGITPINAIFVDKNGYVYVGSDTTGSISADIKIYPPKAQWPTNRQMTPIKTIDIPNGRILGLTGNANGSVLYVSDYIARKVTKYKGSPTAGYTIDNTFKFGTTPAQNDTMSVVGVLDTINTMGLTYMNSNNLLFVACNKWRGGSAWYPKSKIYMLNGNTGAILDTINISLWNLIASGSYQKRPGVGTGSGLYSGYGSTYDVGLDEKKNIYFGSYYAWTVEKWSYTGTLPNIPTTSVRQSSIANPAEYELTANYPNPFNPSTNFRFSIATRQFVSVKIFDMLGHEVASLVNDEMDAGTYTVEWNASNVPSGVYFYQIKAGAFLSTKKMTLMK